MKLSVIEKILIVATAMLLFLGISQKTKSPPQIQPATQIETFNEVKNLGLTVSEFRRAYNELVAKYAVANVRISETYTKGDNIFFFI